MMMLASFRTESRSTEIGLLEPVQLPGFQLLADN